MVYYAGIDLGKRKSHIRVITAERKTVEDLKVENDPKAFTRIFKKYQGEIEVACEASSNAFWVADTLAPIVGKFFVGHATKIRWIAEARIKTDKIDAGILAELLRADLFPSIAIPPRRIRDLRELIRGLVRIRRQTARCRNQVHSLMGRHGIAYKRSEVRGPKLGDLVRESELPRPARIAAEAFLHLENTMMEEEKRLQAEIHSELEGEAKILEEVKRLATIPGVGYFSAALMVLELWDITRFRDEAHLASYIGFVPGTHQTGETLWHGRMTKQGNRLVRWVLVQDAWIARMNHVFFGRLYERHRKRKGGARAIVPVARALLKTIYRVWSEKKTYEELYEKKTLVG
jgi:transposase